MFGWRGADVPVRLCHGIGPANYHQENAGSDWKRLRICKHLEALLVLTASTSALSFGRRGTSKDNLLGLPDQSRLTLMFGGPALVHVSAAHRRSLDFPGNYEEDIAKESGQIFINTHYDPPAGSSTGCRLGGGA